MVRVCRVFGMWHPLKNFLKNMIMRDELAKYFSTFFYLGYFPYAAGSLATGFGGLCAGILFLHPIMLIVVLGMVTGIGFLVSGRMEEIIGQKDPPCIVIDEVAGALIAFFMLPLTWPVFWTTFFVFRAFDMFKIYPASILEKRNGAVGVMMDDIVAGLYTNVIMQITIRLVGLFTNSHL